MGRPPAAQAWTQASRGCARVGAPPPAVLASHPTDASSDSAQSRKALNRASQRAFRDRKQEHVADLEAKVRLLEQGEGERSSFFQSMARTAKEEVTAMRAENDSLRSQLAALQAEKVRGERFGEVEERSRVRREPPRSEEDDLPSKRARRASTRLPDKVVLTYQEDSPSPSSSPVTAFAAVSPPPEERAASPGEPSCGLCASPESCFCSEQGYHIDHSKATTSSIAIPLRPRLATGRTPVWRLDSSGPSSAPSPKPATCSGDPSTCPACQDDPYAPSLLLDRSDLTRSTHSFGQAFCQSLSNSVCSSNPCATCPSRASTSTLVAFTSNPLPPSAAPTMMDDDGLFDSLADLPCCGDPQLCGSLSCGPKVEPFEETLPRSVLPGVRETVPCNEAWTGALSPLPPVKPY